MLLGRAKSCRWQVFVRLRPPKQGELRTDVSKATMFQGDKGGEKAHGVYRPGRNKLSASQKVSKGFNFVCAKLLFWCADSRFAEPQSSLRRETVLFFSRVRKEPKVHQRFANLWTPGTIQSSVRSDFAKFSGGSCRNRFCPQNAGQKALNRCERITVVQTQD